MCSVALCLDFISGHLDDDGLPHGFCTVTYSSTDRFEGNFVHGEKNGRGKFFFLMEAPWRDTTLMTPCKARGSTPTRMEWSFMVPTWMES